MGIKLPQDIGGDGNSGAQLMASLLFRLQQAEIQITALNREMDHNYEAWTLAQGDLYPTMRVRYEYYRCMINAREHTIAIKDSRDKGDLKLLQELKSEYGMVKKAAEKDSFMEAIKTGEEEGARLFKQMKVGKHKPTKLQKGILEIDQSDIVSSDSHIAGGKDSKIIPKKEG